MKKLTPVQKSEKKRKTCVKLAKQIACSIAGYKCEHCGKTKQNGWQMHGSHIHPEGVYKSMSADVDNILCLCATCHVGGFWKNSNKPSWHEDPMYFVEWFKNKYQKRYVELEERKKKSVQLSEEYWNKKHNELKEIWKSLTTY